MPTIIAIDHPDDPRIAQYRHVRERDLVGREGLFIAEGEVVVRVLLSGSIHEPESLLLAEKRLAALAAEIDGLPERVAVYVVPQAIMDEIAGFPMHRGILAVGKRATLPFAGEVLDRLGRRAMVLVLFAIANHDNMGGIFRNAAAFGTDLVIIDSDCCDPLYRKAIRVSAGNVLRVPFVRLDRGADALALLRSRGFEALALSPGGASALSDVTQPDRLAVLLGAEGPGLPDHVLERTKTVRIPMAPGVDSLNVATASGIVLHHFCREEV